MQGLAVEAWQCFASILVNLSQTWNLGRLSQEAMPCIGKTRGTRREKKKKKKEYSAGRRFPLPAVGKRLGKQPDGNPLTDDIASATSVSSRAVGVVASIGRALVKKGCA